jgi:hypothetical protein
MAITVFNEGAGLFHAGSGGKGVAPGDVCLSPPPPPAGPAPVPYVNSLAASDLAEGSTSVLIDGEPTALEDKSYVSTSTGDEAGTQGGNVITHKTKGKGYFTMWSFTLLIEEKGACRHGDPMGQNCASSPPGCVDMKALVAFMLKPGVAIEKCTKKYDRKKLGLSSPTEAQYEKVKGGPCWECQRDLPSGDYASVTLSSGKVVSKASAYVSGRASKQQFTPDHQPPLNVAWYAGGCHMSEEDFKKWANDPATVKPHCAVHSSSQGGVVRGITSGGPSQAFAKIGALFPK